LEEFSWESFELWLDARASLIVCQAENQALVLPVAMKWSRAMNFCRFFFPIHEAFLPEAQRGHGPERREEPTQQLVQATPCRKN